MPSSLDTIPTDGLHGIAPAAAAAAAGAGVVCGGPALFVPVAVTVGAFLAGGLQAPGPQTFVPFAVTGP